MQKYITIAASETDAVDSFKVSKDFIKKWKVTRTTHLEFKALVDSIYVTLTHQQKKQLFAEAVDCFNNSVPYIIEVMNEVREDYSAEVSARSQLAMCITCSLMDYCEDLVN